ncbi:Golgin imh1 [Lecanora helva]
MRFQAVLRRERHVPGAIDSRIAEEQARARVFQASPSRSNSNTGRSTSRNISPSKKSSRQARGRQDGDLQTKGPDPSEFEPEFVIEDEEHSRSRTPKPNPERDGDPPKDQKNEIARDEGNHESGESVASVEESKELSELPTDVQVKLRKLEKLESRYHELLRSYRIAHARVLTIEPFEAALRENTPLTTISDPKALTEYLNQVNLKGDLVLDELKRVSNERDTFKHQLDDAKQDTKKAWDEVANLRDFKDNNTLSTTSSKETGDSRLDNAPPHNANDGDPLGSSTKSPPASIKSPTIQARGLSFFSPKAKPTDSPRLRQGSEDLFSYDDEIPKLETELKHRQDKIDSLETEMKSLKGDLAVTRESTQSMVQTLEEATREVNTLRDSRDRSESELEEQKARLEKISEQLRADLASTESRLQALQSESGSKEVERIKELQAQLELARDEIDNAKSVESQNIDLTNQIEKLQAQVTTLRTELADKQSSSEQSEKKIETLNSLQTMLRSQLKEADEKNQDLRTVIEKSSKASADLQEKLNHLEAQPAPTNSENPKGQTVDDDGVQLHHGSQSAQTGPTTTQDASNAGKKKNKKKKKGGKSSAEQADQTQSTETADLNAEESKLKEPASSETSSNLQDQLRQTRQLLEEKDAAIEKLQGKLKDQEGFQEEIETLRDELVNVGNEHVEAKDQIKELIAQKEALNTTIVSLEQKFAETENVNDSNAARSVEKHQELTKQFEDLKVRAATLQTDLSAAQQLASSRFKDLNDLRNVLQKAQPEINTLRNEAAEVKSVKEELVKKEAEFQRLDSRHEDLRTEITRLKKTLSDRESEIKSVNQKLTQENSGRLKAEESRARLTQEAQRLETEKRRATESVNQLSIELEKAREDLQTSQRRLKDVEQQISPLKNDNENLKEEIELKSAQYASAQSLMASMRDQTTELAMQTKEARERCESLDEEVADAHRLLGERSREGETMRRLLADVESRADARMREMKERLDTAIEERDRAEDEASTAGRRRARELEDVRNKQRDIERNLKRAEEDKEELETAQRDWKRRREELEHRAAQSTREVEDVRRAMGELRDALDESERQARDLEKQKADLLRSVEEGQHRLEKLQKSNKSMAGEISKIQTAKTKSIDSGVPSSRSSPDATPRLGSPAPKSRTSSAAMVDAPHGQPPGAMDLVYLKNVLLQFLEQKDKKHQMQLVPVLGMLLHFDRKDEQKWMSAINTKA